MARTIDEARYTQAHNTPLVLLYTLFLKTQSEDRVGDSTQVHKNSTQVCKIRCHSGASTPSGDQIAIPYSPYSSILGLMVRSSIIWRLICRGRR